MGAYGNTPEATRTDDSDIDGLPDSWELQYWSSLTVADANGDYDNDGLRNIDEYEIGWDPNTDNSSAIYGLVHNENTDINYPNITLAVSNAVNGNIITVPTGTYYETVDFNGLSITLQSTGLNDPNIIANTIIDANDSQENVVSFNHTEGSSSILQGFTITGGLTGIDCNDGSPKIIKCEIIGNQQDGIYCSSGSSPIISNCIIAENLGSGIKGGSPIVTNCTIVKNDSYGVYDIVGDVANSIIWDNNDNDVNGIIVSYSCIEDYDGNFASSVSDANLAIYYTFDDNEPNTTVIDETGNHNGTASSNTSVLNTLRLEDLGGYCFEFNGSSNYITTNYNSLKTENNFTIALWFNTNDANWSSHLFFQGESGSDGWDPQADMHLSFGYWSNYATYNNHLTLFMSDDIVNASDEFYMTVEFSDLHAWHHVAVVFEDLNSSPKSYMYLDGELVDSDTSTVANIEAIRTQWNTNLIVGRGGTSSGYFEGLMDEFKVYTRALSTTDISRLYYESLNHYNISHYGEQH